MRSKIHMLNQYPCFPSLNSFHPRPAVFELLGIETNALNDRQMTLNNKRSNVPHMHSASIPESLISLPFSLQPTVFELQTIFETSAPNGRKMILNTKRSKVQHIHIITTNDSQISLHFALRSVLSEIQAILRHVY